MIKKLIPDKYYKTINDIPYTELYDKGFRLILTDLDNTLISYKETDPTIELHAWLKMVKEIGFEVIIVSNSKKYRVDVNQEMILTRNFIVDLIHMIEPKKVIIVMGNHEYRMGRYLSDNLNEDIMTLMPDTPMDLIINDGFKVRDRLNKTETWYSPLSEVFEEEGIEISYTGEWFRKVGKTIFAHPLSYSSGMLKTTEKAVNFFLREDRDFEAIVLGHTHKLGSYIQGKIRMYEQGCCCNLQKLDYNNGQLVLPGQNRFIYLCQDKDGNLIPEETRLVEI